MDNTCFSASNFLDHSIGLIDDIKEPSLTSLEDSVTSFKDVAVVREDSFSDGEAMRNIMTSTPQKKNEQRRSVSLVDVSKLESFSSRPLGNMLSSWETIGSQSSVGKSRDSGYIHSGSLLSINSAKLSELKDCTDQMGVVLEECSRLKRDLEYSEVLINTLQESNNDLRMKCAAAHNRISEMRLKFVNHCDCCSQQNNSDTRPILNSESVLESNESSSSSDRSRSPSPQPSRSQSCRLFSPRSRSPNSRTSKVHNAFLRRDEDSFSDLSEDTPRRAWPLMRNLTEPISGNLKKRKSSSKQFIKVQSVQRGKPIIDAPAEKQIRNFNLARSHTTECSSYSRNPSEYDSFAEEEDIALLDICSSQKSSSNLSESVTNECDSNNLNIPSSSNEDVPLIKNEKNDNKFHSVEDLFASIVKEKALEDNKPVFVANEFNGKICVGNFRVWQKPKVSPRSSLLTSPMTTVSNASPSYDKVILSQSSDRAEKSNVKYPVQTNFQVRVSISPSPQYASRPVSVCSTFSQSPNISCRRQISSSTLSLNSRENYVKVDIQNPHSGNNAMYGTSSQFSPVQSTSSRIPSTSCSQNKSYTPSSDISNSNFSSNSTPSNSKRNSCQENLSNLGVTVTKKEKKSNSDSWMSKFKLNKIPLGFLIQSDSSEKVGGVQSSKTAQNVDGNNSSREGDMDESQLVEDSLPHSVNSRQENSAQHYSENIQDCLDNADQLSRKVAQLLNQLKYIQNIGKA